MSILLALKGMDIPAWVAGLKEALPDHPIVLADEDYDPAAIDYAVVWQPDDALFRPLSNLKVIFSAGAGVDHILRHPALPDVPIVRAVDTELSQRMTHYILSQVFFHHRKMFEVQAAQARGEWIMLDQPSASRIRVGIMGLGVLGTDAAEKLKLHGYDVAGWSRTEKQIDGIRTYSGEDGLDALLGWSDILVCLLPSTPATADILNYDLFSKLPQTGVLGGPVLINVGRGALQKEEDIIRALDDGTLMAASLDVFKVEPLPQDSPLWGHPRIVITPHVAADSDPAAFSRSIGTQVRKFESGKPLDNQVDKTVGY
ncbi:2-hydroxyacid dehydrogenase [Coralliovum pocilloporae]|uniref:2-hydroxyacid dehydrogenase n=1 Tax=Coralliovum pocilloporae TaxID=3066369 RepID=UPI003307334B